MAQRPRKTEADPANDDGSSSSTIDQLFDNISRRTREGRRRAHEEKLKRDQDHRKSIAKLARDFVAAAEALSGQPLEELEKSLRLVRALQPKPDLARAADADRYENRTDKSQTAPAFIEAKYEWLLDGTHARPDLGVIDDSALSGLRGWEQRHGKLPLEKFNLPTVEQLNTVLIESGVLDCDLVRDIHRLRSVESVRKLRIR